MDIHGHEHSDRSYEWIGNWSKKKARLAPEETALVDATTGEEWTYTEMNDRANRTARALRDAGLGKGDRVSIIARNRVEYVDLFFACGKIGAILAPYSYRLAPGEVAQLFDQVEPDLLLVEDAFADLGAATLAAAETSAETYTLESAVPLEEAPPWEPWADQLPADDSPVETADLTLNDPYMLIHTGGSTGLPKETVIPHGQVVWNSVNSITATLGFTHENVGLTIYPFFHIGGWNSVAAWHAAATVVITRDVDAGELLSVIEEYDVDGFAAVPTVLRQMAQHEDWETTDLSRLEYVNSGGGPCRRSIMEQWWDRGIDLSQGYGMTECGPSDFDMPIGWPKGKAQSIGVPPMHVDAKIVDEHDNEVPEGEIGELLLASPAAAARYWENEGETAETFDDGWVRTGDLARKDDDGYYYIEGRKKNMFTSGGENVYPPAIEDAIADHPKVNDVVIVPVPDDQWGHVGKAVVEGDESLTLEELEGFLEGRIAGFKKPHHLAFVDEMPMSGPSKVDRQAIVEEFGEE